MNPAQARKGGLASPEASWRCSFFRAVKSYWFGCLLSHNHQTVKRSVNLPAGEKKPNKKTHQPLFVLRSVKLLESLKILTSANVPCWTSQKQWRAKKKKKKEDILFGEALRLKRFPLWSHEAEGDNSLRRLERRNRALLKLTEAIVSEVVALIVWKHISIRNNTNAVSRKTKREYLTRIEAKQNFSPAILPDNSRH